MMSLTPSEKSGSPQSTRATWLSLTVAASIPVVAICVFLYISIEGLGHEIATLARLYGQFLFKEQITRNLLTMARCLQVPQREEGPPTDRMKPGPVPEEILKGTLCTERGEFLLVVEKTGATVLYPTDVKKGPLAFLEETAKKDEFFRMIEGATPEMPVQGYFCEDPGRDRSGPSGMWYVSAVPVGKDFLLVAVISEQDIRVAGDTLEAAQQELLRRKGYLFIFYVLPVGLASALLIGYLFSGIRTHKKR